jgi:ribosomal 30S subunit maturation factor RimM
VGLEAVDEQGARLGRVESVWNTGPVPNLVLRSPHGEEWLVPFADDFVLQVDVEGRRIVMRKPDHLE